MLALSALFVLVPIAAPVHASQNASLPAITNSTNAYISGAATTGVQLTITNPITNAYAITSFTVFTPTNFAFTKGTYTVGTYLNSVSVDTTTGTTFTITGSSGGIPPGFSDTITLDTITSSVSSPVTAAPPQSTFSTVMIDAGSSPASYPGPTWTVYTLATTTTNPTVTVSETTYVAGSAAVTVTATESSNQPGVPITFSVPTGYPTHHFTTSFTPTTTTTVSGTASSTATSSWQPSNYAGDSAMVTATVGSSTIDAVKGTSPAVATVAGAPSSVAWTIGTGPGTAFGVGKTLYLTTGVSGVSYGTTTYSGTTIEAQYAADMLYVAVSDAFGNSLAFTSFTSPAMTVTAPSGIGGWSNGGTTVVNPITCVNSGISCSNGEILFPYAQLWTYGTTTVLQATITGTYNNAAFSVAATSGNIITGTAATGLSLAFTNTGTPAWGVGGTVTLTASQTGSVTTQPGVPVTFNLCGQQKGATVCLSPATTKNFGGSFSSGAQTGFVVNTGGTLGTAAATYTLPTVLGQVGNFNATAPAPTGATPTPLLVSNIVTSSATVASSPYGFTLVVCFNNTPPVITTPTCTPSSAAVKSSLVSGQSVYVNVGLVDQYGNPTANLGNQIQINLATTAGTLFATVDYIGTGFNYNSLGPIQFSVPSTVAIGTVITLTATGPYATGTKAITIVSATPTINLKKGSTNGAIIAPGTTIYSPTGAITFYSKANASAGLNPATTQVQWLGTKIGSSPWVTTLTPGVAQSVNTFSLFFPTGLSTLNVNASDNSNGAGKLGNVGTDGPFTILVDPYVPTFTINTPAVGAGSDTVTVASQEGDFNTSTFAATYGGNAVPASSIAWSGTQTLGSPSTLTATISGLTAGTNTLAVSGSTDAGLSGSASASITITVIFANSITFTTSSATWGQSGSASGIFVPVTNSWSTAQQLTIYVTLKSGSSTYVLVGGETLAAGQTGTVFCQDFLTAVPVGTYTATFSALTTANQAVSAPTTAVSITT